MALYQYRAASAEGHINKGQIEALNEFDLEAQLKRIDLLLVSAKALKSRQRIVKSMPRREVIDFFFQIEMLVRAGVPLLTALGDMRDEAESPSSRDLSSGLFEKIEAGSTFGEAVAAYPGVFSPTIVSLIRSGEVTGQLPDVLKEIVRSLKWQDEMASTTKKLLMYPSFVLVVIGGVVFFLMIYLVPQLVGFLNNMGQAIPLQTRLLIGLSSFFVNYWWLILSVPPALVMLTLSLSAAFPAVRYKLHQMQLSIPYVGPVLKKMILARFADTFALMYRTGIPLIEGLVYCQEISSNVVIQQAIRRARERVINGASLSESFAAEALFPSLVIRMLKVGESTGALDSALSNISYFYTRDIDESVGKVQAMIEPALTVVMGLILGWIMLAVLGPIYDTIAKMKT
ncbi:MAG: type II secretion system F family protein [Gammaproteobacteria bacterium]|uniref:type II secretion system F family protein n=1 Tax=Rhodoferax sp. TaxID=50421 RepID=UPI001793F9E1|nr:type II secretion system F family protein [Rhodoferax sp.]MBU3898055.1 type II secretion system F family protein [Gammaproteobacteria bacterium]MBA3058554.1 type II secretion system F family protein [Rhodoferax sp.]MBU3999188.1 type II secretion system F family protein [Gammaproteobacteria bacterium]MBU4081751.1 type II secretion system F family protein [Gammaproteobacteria bacterium]MBU4112756.1 type II secretion system F family protein [Gammaproteobacteria bacterium]